MAKGQKVVVPVYSIRITDRFEGQHRWPNAPDVVSFLRHPHRHLFGVSVKIQVEDPDRGIEFFMAKQYLADAIRNLKKRGIAEMSCETMALRILEYLRKLNIPAIECSVDEDGENAGIVELENRVIPG